MMRDDFEFYIGEDLQVRTGEEARTALKIEGSDSSFVEPGLGVMRVTRERWRKAQVYEKRTWMESGAHAREDRNSEHSARFGGYAALDGKIFSTAIEIGCGPFTNLRIIANSCVIRSCTLLDPLIETYQRHRHCTYPGSFLRGRERWIHGALSSTLPGRTVRRILSRAAPSLFYRGVPIAGKIALPIEDYAPQGSFDLIVMINVLEHCFDAKKVFERLDRIQRPGSLLVFHDKLYRADAVEKFLPGHFDAGHPLRLEGSIIRNYLAQGFRVLFEHEERIPDSCGQVDLTEIGLYFIGERL